MSKQEGGCLCGAVRYLVAGPLSDVHACHCGQCRRQSGHFVAATNAARAHFTLTQDRGLKWYRSSEIAQRGFCAECGSALFWDDGAGEISINAGSLDQPTGLALTRHIFVESRGDYYRIDDGLPQFIGADTPAERA